jgi:hypothetical protein
VSVALTDSDANGAAARDDMSVDLTLAEVKQLWWFMDGSIMDVGVRHHLWSSWGFCPRHTWAHAIAEIELRYTPLGTAILYEDLLDRARRVVARGWEPSTLRRRALQPHASCYTCDYANHADVPDRQFADQQRRVNARRRFADRVLREDVVWAPRACPVCTPDGRGLPCRRHLIDEAAELDGTVADGLTELGQRLHVFMRSLTWRGPVAEERHRSAFVETLGWFAGWQIPLSLAAQVRPTLSS